MQMLKRFHDVIRGKDINTVKSVEELSQIVNKKTRKEHRSDLDKCIVYDDDVWRVSAPTSHEQSMHAGGGTSWCISTSNDGYWDEYYNRDGSTFVFIWNPDSR